MNLDEIRVEIDKVDAELKKLFLKRMELVHNVYLYKKENNLPVKNAKREAEIIENKTKDVSDFKDEIKEFFKTLIDISCKYQEQALNTEIKIDTEFTHKTKEEFLKDIKKVSYQGILGSYGSEMAKKLFIDKELVNKKTFLDVCKSVKTGETQVGILPIENLSAGSISEVYDLIYENSLNIVMADELLIEHCLLGTGSIDEIKKVKSHPQALSQCSEFILKNNYEKEESINTAVAALSLSQSRDNSVGVICNKINSEYYNLNVLKENISNIKGNKTRFIAVTNDKVIIDNPKKISMVFTLPHKVGSLARVLYDFSNNSFNLTKIESRPVKSNEWEYVFYVDVEGTLLDDKTKEHLKKISCLFEKLQILGNY